MGSKQGVEQKCICHQMMAGLSVVPTYAVKTTAKVWNIPGWDELGLKPYDPNSIQTFCHPELRPTTPIVLVEI